MSQPSTVPTISAHFSGGSSCPCSRYSQAQPARDAVSVSRISPSKSKRKARTGTPGDGIDTAMAGETRKAVFAQPDWLWTVPTDRRLPEGAVVVHTGCGTSFHAAQTGGWAVQALEAALRAPRADVMVCVSHEGATELTIAAERAFGGDVWLVTGNPESELAQLADEVIVCTPEVERSWCHTASYTCAVAAIAALHGD